MGRTMSTCHPEKPSFGGGLCAPCYARKKYSELSVEARRDQWKKKKKRRNRKGWQYRRYGLTPDQVEHLRLGQCNACKICLREFPVRSDGKYRMCIDHDHITGKVRALLCNNCNLALGHFKDNDFILARAIAYLMWSGTLPANFDWQTVRFVDLPASAAHQPSKSPEPVPEG